MQMVGNRLCLSLGLWCGLTAWAATSPVELELDLSPSAQLKGVLALPPVSSSVVSKSAFVGVDTRKKVERFLLPAHQKLVTALNAKLDRKVIPADVVVGMLTQEGVLASAVEQPATITRLAEKSGVNWVITFTVNKAETMLAQILDAQGQPRAESCAVAGATALTDAQAQTLAACLAPRLLAAHKAALDAAAAATAQAEAPPPAPPEEDIVDAELERMKQTTPAPTRALDKVDRGQMRALAVVGPGAVMRDLQLSGESSQALALLENGTVVGMAVGAQVLPLEFFESTAGKAWSQLSVEVHYRKAFVHAQGTAGGLEGQSCKMTDDDLQVRVGGRYRLGSADSALPTVGLAAGWSQEQTQFDCNLPLLSATWRGVDAQLRIRQPLYRDILTLELVGGPRVLMGGAQANSPAFSFSGEAWLEAKPYSIVFARAGVRASRLAAATPTLSVVDTRTFVALEIGAFF